VADRGVEPAFNCAANGFSRLFAVVEERCALGIHTCRDEKVRLPIGVKNTSESRARAQDPESAAVSPAITSVAPINHQVTGHAHRTHRARALILPVAVRLIS
jgi:hypothetical protein